ncbi:MAG TPA: DUF1801 domain-containing protein [Thermoanaerobaculaceae bacterium]|nr:DUF1801 domain-containing protein [Thermoanaerobaculaceae bacterium]
MAAGRTKAENVDAYIAGFAPQVRRVLERVRRTIRAAAPGAEEVISYGIPAYRLQGILVYFGAFERHIGLYPPIRGDAAIERAVAPYAGEKGNLRFPLDRPIPYGLVTRIVKLRVRQNLGKVKGKSASRTRGGRPAAGR